MKHLCVADTPSVSPHLALGLAPAETWVQLEGLLVLGLEISEDQRTMGCRETTERQGEGERGREKDWLDRDWWSVAILRKLKKYCLEIESERDIDKERGTKSQRFTYRDTERQRQGQRAQA